MRDMASAFVLQSVAGLSIPPPHVQRILRHDSLINEMPQSHDPCLIRVWHDSFDKRTPLLRYMCRDPSVYDATHLCICRAFFVCDMTHSCVTCLMNRSHKHEKPPPAQRSIKNTATCENTHSCVTWLNHTWHVCNFLRIPPARIAVNLSLRIWLTVNAVESFIVLTCVSYVSPVTGLAVESSMCQNPTLTYTTH